MYPKDSSIAACIKRKCLEASDTLPKKNTKSLKDA
jgi:hypothetical protein